MYETKINELINSIPKELLIGGVWKQSSSAATFGVEDPATGHVLAKVADGTPADGEAALKSANDAQKAWCKVSPRERGDILRRAYQLIIDRADDFALLISLEMGKPVNEAKSEVIYGAEFLRWFSEESVRAYGRYSKSPDGKARVLVTKKPVGPCLLITPWNFPLAMATRKVAPAVAAGCTMVLKPSDLTPLTAALFTEVMMEAGLPAGVLNLIQTSRAEKVCTVLFRDLSLRKVSFTGSTRVGKQILRQSAEVVLRTSMELGGNAPFIVFADADIAAAVEGAMVAKMRNMGEACTAANRFIVHASVAKEFSALLTNKMKQSTVGRGTDKGVTVGPIINEVGRKKIQSFVDDAVAKGANVLTGGKIPLGEGYFYPPTVLINISFDAQILQEEIFGPVAPIVTFKTEEQAIALANATEYGLVCYVYTRDLNRGIRMGECLETGMLGLNAGAVSNAAAPFGGVKQSGLGREGGVEGIDEYLYTQYVGVADPYAGLTDA